MLKIKITDLEEKIGYKIKRNYKTVGWDTAKICGVSFIKTDEEFVYFDWCVLEFEKVTEEDLLTQMYKEFGKLMKNEDFAVVEQVFLGFNPAGSLILAKMGTMVCAQCIQKNIPFKLISATSARSKFKINSQKYGKGKSKLAVSDWIKETLGIELEENNVSDAIVLGMIGICEDMNFKSKTKKKKT